MTPPAFFGIFSRSKKVSFEDCQHIAASIQAQLTEDVLPIWGRRGTVTAYVEEGDVPHHVWKVVIEDDIGQPGALGYHTDEFNQPVSFVSAQGGDLDAVCTTASHECLTGDTLIPLLNGKTVPIKDLVGLPEFWVYACKSDGSLRPGRGHSARLTKLDAEIVEVMLDNGKSIRCTKDHLCMLRDGSYLEAGKLQIGQSLMPLYRDVKVLDSNKPRKGMYPYEHVLDNRTEKWTPTHRMVVPFCSSGYVRHHKDFNRFNNEPPNIEMMKWDDHQKLHRDHIRQYASRPKKISDEERKKRAERGRENFRKYNGSEKQKEAHARYLADKDRVLSMTKKASETWIKNGRKKKKPTLSGNQRRAMGERLSVYNKSDSHRKTASYTGRKAMERLFSNPEWKAAKLRQNSAVCSLRNHKKYHEEKGITNPDCPVCRGELTCVPPINHKVVSVSFVGREDVYDITVDKYHNFATEAGVFVHNCLETLMDPFGNRLISILHPMNGPLNHRRVRVLCEACDMPEAKTYLKNGLPVSDFITPEWFDDHKQDGIKYSFLGSLSAPRTLAPGGYMSFIDTDNRWYQLTYWGSEPILEGPFAFDTADESLRETVDKHVRNEKDSLP